MARYPVNLPSSLKQEAEKLAANQGVSLNQFILWAVAVKVGNLRQELRYIPVDMKYMETLAVRRRRGEAFGSAIDLWSERLALADNKFQRKDARMLRPYKFTLPLIPSPYSLDSLRAFVSLW